MPSGNAHRTWFPEMVEATSSMQCCIAFVRRGTSVLPSSNARCGHVGEGAEPHVTVRAMILSLVRFGIAPAEPVNTLEKGWAAYRKQKGLDLCGKTLDPAPASTRPCAHTVFR